MIKFNAVLLFFNDPIVQFISGIALVALLVLIAIKAEKYDRKREKKRPQKPNDSAPISKPIDGLKVFGIILTFAGIAMLIFIPIGLLVLSVGTIICGVILISTSIIRNR